MKIMNKHYPAFVRHIEFVGILLFSNTDSSELRQSRRQGLRFPNLVPRVLRLFGQRLVTRRDSGELEFYYHRISPVKQWKPLKSSQSKHLNFCGVPRVSPGAHPLTKKPEDSGYEIVVSLEQKDRSPWDRDFERVGNE